MSSYKRTFWEDSPKTEITAERLNNMEKGIENLHNAMNQTQEGQFVLPDGLKICWGQDTLGYGNGHVAHGIIYFPFHYQNPPIVIASKLLLNQDIANGWLDIQTTCSHRNISIGSFSASLYNSNGSFSREEENHKYFAVSWIAIGY